MLIQAFKLPNYSFFFHRNPLQPISWRLFINWFRFTFIISLEQVAQLNLQVTESHFTEVSLFVTCLKSEASS